MSHEIEEGHGAYSRHAAWHRLLNVENDPSVYHDLPLFLNKYGMDHRIVKTPACYAQEGIDDQGGPTMVPVIVPDQYHLQRTTDGKIVSKATVGAQYAPVAMADPVILPLLSALVSEGLGYVDGAFSLSDGTRDVLTLRLGDETDSGRETYAVISLPHGLGCVLAKVTQTRVVCNNTETAVFGHGRNRSGDFKIPHRSMAVDRTAWAIKTWTELREYAASRNKAISVLEETPADVPQTILDILGVDRQSSKRAKNQALRIMDYASSPTRNGTENRTLGDVYHAFTYWATHDTSGIRANGSTDRKMLESHLYGSRGKIEQDAASKLMAMVP